jgi:hypothetical protein
MIYFDKELSGELKEMMHNDLIGYTPKMKKFVNKFFDLFGIPSAHAQGGMAMMAGSMLLSTLGNQIDDPWVKQIFNLGSRLLMLQGLLGKLAKDHALISPQNRAITWALMAVMGEVAISFLAETLEKVRKNIEVVEMERTRYFNSAATRTSIRNTERVGDATLKLKKYDYTASRTAGMKVKACAVPKGDGFAPAMCPAVIPKQAFSLPEISSGSRNHLNPDFLNGMSLLSDVSYGAATGSLDGANMSEGDLGKLETLQNALSQQNSKLRDKVDAHDSKIAAVKKFNSPSLQSVHASFKKEFGGGGKNSSGTSPIASTSSGGYFGGNKEEKKEESTGTSKTTAGTAGTAAIALPKSKGIDLDFGDDDAAAGGTVTDDALGAATSDKSEEKLDDFVLNHDDINKRADIPIWKILSNRYILSYPKILEEEEQKGSPPQSEPVQQ